jgi:predicted ATPase
MRAYADALTVLTRRLALEPWAEEAHRQVMLTHSRLRNFNAALAHYATCRKLLAEELGVEPMPETVALAARIQAARRTAAASLPSTPTPLIGRQALVARIRHLLTEPTCRLVTLVGLGGMGKTRLALEVAHQINQEETLIFLHGVTFVPLEGVESATALPQALAAALNLTLPGGVDVTAALLHYLHAREQLLVFDNVEQLLVTNPPPRPGTRQPGNGDVATLITQIIRHCPEVKLLVTSRTALHLSVEWRVDLAGLAYPEAGETARDEPFAAVQFFAAAARQSQPAFALTPDNTEHVHRLCQLVGGMPLALQLAATWLRGMSCAAIVAAVAQHPDALSTPWPDRPPRQRNIRMIFDAAWHMLRAEEQPRFAALSLFRGGFTAAGAKAVAGATPTQLARLIDQGLLQLWLEEADVRYRMHELIRQYAAEKVAAHDYKALARAHAAFYMALAETIESEVATVAGTRWLTRLAQERDNVRTAIEWLLQPAHGAETTEIALRLVAALWPTWCWRAAWQEGGEWLQQLLARPAAAQATKGRAKALRFAGVMAHFEGKLSTARTLLAESVAVCRTIGDQRALAYSLLGLGVTLRDLGDHATAAQGLREGLTFFQTSNDGWGASLVNNELGRIAMSQGAYAAAQRFFEESLAQARALQDAWGVIYLLHNLLALAQAQHDDAAARACYGEILAIHQTLPPYGPQMHALQAMTLSAYILGDVVAWSAHFVDDYATAVALFEEQLAVSRERGDEQLTARLLNHLGDVVRAKGDQAHALALYQQSLALFQRLDLPAGVALVLHNLGQIHLQRGNLLEAAAKFTASLRLYQVVGLRWNQADCLVGLAGVAAAQGTFEAAAQLLGAAHTLHHAVDVSGAYASPTIRRDGERICATVRGALPDDRWAAAWAAGVALANQEDREWLYTLSSIHLPTQI